jgi:hypothetical protein
MMTLTEIGNLQINDKIQLPNGVEGTVFTNDQSNKLIGITMPAGDFIYSMRGDVPPDPARIDAETTVVCAWVDLTTSTKVVV